VASGGSGPDVSSAPVAAPVLAVPPTGNLTPRDILLRRGFGCCETFTIAVSRGMQESTIGCRGGADIACSHYCICSENPRLIRRQLLLQIYWNARKYESTGQAARHSYSTKTNLFEHEKPVGEENRGVLLSRQAPCKGVS